MRRGDNCPQSHDGFLGQAIAEVLLRGIAAQVFKRKNGEHDARPFLDLCHLDFRGNGSLALEAIPFAEYGLDILRLAGIVSEGIADLSDSGVDAVIGIEVKVLPPESLNNFLAADHPFLFPHQEDEQIHGDAFHAHCFSRASKFVPVYIQDKRSELHSL